MSEISHYPSPFSRFMEITAETHGAVVNIHDVRGITALVPDLRVKPDQLVHHGAFCRFAKLHGKNKVCSENKRRSLERAASGDGAFWGCCPFGVWDLAQPVQLRGELLAVVYVGYFTDKNPVLPVERMMFNGPSPARIRRPVISQLRTAAGHLAGLACMAVEHWLRLGGSLEVQRSEDYYRRVTERFIASHFGEKVLLSDFANELNIHPHYLGKMILKSTGRAFADLLRARRIEQAKLLLKISDLPVTTIAFESGFQDSNYFSLVFRQREGCSPTDWHLRETKNAPATTGSSCQGES